YIGVSPAINLTLFCSAVVVRFGGSFRGHTRKPQPSLSRNTSNFLFIAKARIAKCAKSPYSKNL
ncbi:hypothetical protein, partial [Lysinibacillus sphaericus]